MGKVRWHVTMSLDGFIAGPNDAINGAFGYVPQGLLLPLVHPKFRKCGTKQFEPPVPSKRPAQLQRGKKARTASRSSKGEGWRLEWPDFRAHAPCSRS